MKEGVQHSDGTKNLGFTKTVTDKIVDKNRLLGLLPSFPREATVVMCHGTFDLVHPGHLRHLAYARSKGDILIVSVTSDQFVLKANARPYVPEDLRSLNLAALELVDYVIIDNSEDPLQLISTIKPDVFVKGFEYSGALPPKTLSEQIAVEEYGGKMLFSPGDFVLSSSRVIENDPPRIGLEKLLTLMQVENVTFRDLFRALDSLSATSVTVVGDTIVDSITSASIIGGFRKTPTPSVRVDGTKKFVGGAGIVAKHMAATGAKVNFVTILGQDDLGEYVRSDIEQAGINLRAQIVVGRPTTHKNAVVADGYRLIRIDTVENDSISSSVLDEMIEDVSRLTVDSVVFSDFRHGIFNKGTIPAFMSAVPDGVLKVADSQVASRWGNILDFAGCDLITPNEQEVRFALGDQDSVIRPLGTSLYKNARCKTLMLKLGARGMLTFRGDLESQDRRSFFAIGSLAREHIQDAVGSGDALLAYATLTQVATGSEVLSSIIGTIAAGLECEFEGNVPVSLELVRGRLAELEKASDFS